MTSTTEKIQASFCLLIGEMLVESGRITSEQLEAATAEHQQTGERIGQVLVRQGLISPEELVQFLENQLRQRLQSSQSLRRQLGEILLADQSISRWQLAKALSLQGKVSQKVGQILIELGYTSRGMVEQALSHQTVGRCDKREEQQRNSLGRLLLQIDRVTPEALESALKIQAISQEYLGDILIRQGLLTEEELEDLLAIQMLMSSLEQSQQEVRPVHKRLGEILVDTHQLTPQQLQQIIDEQSQKRVSPKLGELLLEKGLIPFRELQRALRLQKRLATLAMTTLAGATLLMACGTPRVPDQTAVPILTQMQIHRAGPVRADQGPFKTLQVDSGAKLQVFQNGSRLISDVPFVLQGDDNTCGQAVMTSLLNFWGYNIDYQSVVNEANPRNLPTTDFGMTNYLREKGLEAQPFRGATLDNLIAEVNKGRPTVVLLDFGGISQEHYVIVTGYNPTTKAMIVHDSLEGPYIQIPMDRFAKMWDNRSIRQVHIFGGENYRRFMLSIDKPAG